MSTETVALYVGADNETGFLDLGRIERLVAKNHEGFTILESVGHWRGEAEDSAVIIVADDSDLIADTVQTLKTELHQDAVGVQYLPDIEFA